MDRKKTWRYYSALRLSSFGEFVLMISSDSCFFWGGAERNETQCCRSSSTSSFDVLCIIKMLFCSIMWISVSSQEVSEILNGFLCTNDHAVRDTFLLFDSAVWCKNMTWSSCPESVLHHCHMTDIHIYTDIRYTHECADELEFPIMWTYKPSKCMA